LADILKANESLAPYTYLKIGGPAEVLAEPRDLAQLTALVRRCLQQKLPLRVLGGGGNLLVRDEGVRGVIVRLCAPAFNEVSVQGKRVRAGCGATLAALISHSARAGLAGLENLVGIAGTVGGALRHNASERGVEIGQFVRAIDVIDAGGNPQTRERDEMRFVYGGCNVDDPVLLAADFDLEPDQDKAIVKRMRKSWILRKAAQPFSFQAAARVFKNPSGLSASALIEQAGLVGTKVGTAQVSERNANYIVAEPGSSARDVLRLIELIRTRVEERFHLELELELSVW
jgi:UDP-N-acetylmuramate dehydrogenase